MKKIYPIIISAICCAQLLQAQKVSSILNEVWSGSTWTNNALSTFTYDAGQNLIKQGNQNWNTSASSWSNTTQFTYTNNASGDALRSEMAQWTASQWSVTSANNYTYNAANKLSTSQAEIWNGSAWIPASKFTYTYDASSYLIATLYQSWDVSLSAFVNITQYNYTNDANGYPLQMIYQNWVSASSTWTNVAKITYTNNASGKVVTQLLQGWNGTAWINSNLTGNIYDANGNIQTTDIQIWDPTSQVYNNFMHWAYVNLPSGLLSQYTIQMWDNSSGTYTNSTRATYSYQNFQPGVLTVSAVSNITSTTAVCGGTVTADGGAQVTTRGICYSTSANPTTANQVVNSGAGLGAYTVTLTGLTANTVYYARAFATNSVGTTYGSEVTFTTQAVTPPGETGIDENLLSKLLLYPVPAGNELYISNALQQADYSIIDATGALVLKGKITGNNEVISVQSLASGIYYIRIDTWTARFVKE